MFNIFKKHDEKIRNEIDEMYQKILEEELEKMEKKYAELLVSPSNANTHPERIAELEVKMAKLWGLLLTVTPKGEDKLTRTGKRFGGQSRTLIK